MTKNIIMADHLSGWKRDKNKCHLKLSPFFSFAQTPLDYNPGNLKLFWKNFMTGKKKRFLFDFYKPLLCVKIHIS